jgi:hypothetical protein
MVLQACKAITCVDGVAVSHAAFLQMLTVLVYCPDQACVLGSVPKQLLATAWPAHVTCSLTC